MVKQDEKIIEEFQNYCRQYHTLAIYGTGRIGQLVSRYMARKGMPYDFFCVSGRPEASACCGRPVVSYDMIEKPGRETGIILAVSEERGVGALCSMLENQAVPYFYSREFLEAIRKDELAWAEGKVEIQDDYLIRVEHSRFQRDVMYLCCPDHIGDTIYVAALVKSYKAERKDIDKVCMIVRDSQRELVAAFPSVDQVIASSELAQTLLTFSECTRKTRFKNYRYAFELMGEPFPLDYENTMVSSTAKLLLDLSGEPFLEDPCFSNKGPYDKKCFSSIILMPYASTSTSISGKFWENLVKHLCKRGYIVYTNCGGEREAPIPGTQRLHESIVATAEFAEKCRAVISIRSGMCDVLGFTNANLIVLNISETMLVQYDIKKIFSREGLFNVNLFEQEGSDSALSEILQIVDLIGK